MTIDSSSKPRRVALITGCGLRDGIGAATARTLARAGIAVVVTDLTRSGVVPSTDEKLVAQLKAEHGSWRGIDSLVEEISDFGGEALALTGDVSSEADAQRMVADAYEQFGSVDILVNNAAASQTFLDIEDFTLEQWERIFAVNVRGAFLMSRAAVKYMRQRAWGRIVNITSVSADEGHAGFAAFTAAKSALTGFTRALAADVGPQGITVMAVAPGLMMTSRGKLATRRMYQDDLDAGARRIAVRRYGEPEDIAAVIRFIASEDSSYVSGEIFRVSGGGGL
ncbi:SDR family oxidoreductase [Burkholderia sp. Ax-1719]|uniref:SDR family NAD(P)-dependent oxidoreductase n=1 Tax=Burkholderia sp. Ax-1719 TaxID=2608334 RepID=UPI001F044919|nr:SDR family oxidoreductase [Burkholderia sp. Ax-1719]NIE66880.1 SDR family oxidoreductase [Burkholderia sp. Ax-1719]